MANGTTKAIEDLNTGDMVWATDPETGNTRAREVTDTRDHKSPRHMVTLTLDTDGDQGHETSQITSTDEHPYWLPAAGRWANAENLEPGMWLRTSTGTWVQVTAVDHTHATKRVHNLTVAATHTYYVLAGETPVLVHNSGGTCPANLQSGNSAAAARGTRVHNGPEWGEHLDSLGYSRGGQISPGNIPDGFTADGFPVELKPNTKSGIKAGTRQLRRYMNEMGVDYGEMWTYRDTSDGVVFDLVRVPNGSRRWTKW